MQAVFQKTLIFKKCASWLRKQITCGENVMNKDINSFLIFHLFFNILTISSGNKNEKGWIVHFIKRYENKHIC